MKQFNSLFNIFLSLLFLAISFYPCKDSAIDLGIANKNASTNVTYVTQSYSNIDHLDVCSPLCTCSCCAVSLTVADVFNIQEIISIENNHKTPLNHIELVIRMEYPIWQPPELLV